MMTTFQRDRLRISHSAELLDWRWKPLASVSPPCHFYITACQEVMTNFSFKAIATLKIISQVACSHVLLFFLLFFVFWEYLFLLLCHGKNKAVIHYSFTECIGISYKLTKKTDNLSKWNLPWYITNYSRIFNTCIAQGKKITIKKWAKHQPLSSMDVILFADDRSE